MIADFGVGLGGATRALHNQTVTWVSGFEASPLLVGAFDLENLDLRAGPFNIAFW
jgi:hypothetical protein